MSFEKNRIWEYLPVNYISLIGCERRVKKEWLLDQLQNMLGSVDSKVFCGVDDVTIISTIQKADSILHHEFEILGIQKTFVNSIEWSLDIRTGYSWPIGKFYRKQLDNLPQGVDIKNPWELSRCHHLLWLGEAFLYSGNEKYALEVISEISDWIDKNPFMRSVNWTCSMDVAIRAVNWMYALLFIKATSFFSDEFATKVLKSFYQHAFFIQQNMEKQIPYSNNHYAADIVGLLYLGELFNDHFLGKWWKKIALKEFFNEIRLQILPSGVHYERSVSYHRLMIELYSYPIYMLVRVGIYIPSDILNIIKKMYEFSANYVKANGYAPMVGDNDNGRFLPFVPRDFRDHRYINDVFSLENSVVSYGITDHFCSNNTGTKLYDDAGFSIIKNRNVQIFVSNGDFSKYPSESMSSIQTHTHNDSLSFDLSLGTDDVIVDPGTYLYTSCPSYRNQFRSTQKHNTIVVDCEEQNELPAESMFSLVRNSVRTKLKLRGNSVFGQYRTITGNFLHKRLFDLDECKLNIIDILEKKGDNSAKMYFHFASGLDPSYSGNKVSVVTSNYYVEMFFEEGCAISLIEDTVSPSFGVLKESKTAVISFKFNDKISIKTIIKWTIKSNIK